MKKIFLIALLGLVLSGCAKNYQTYGIGANTCQEWLESRSSIGKKADAEAFNSWLAGWVSGAGYANEKKLKKIDTKILESRIVNYCKKKPTAQVKDAAEDLVDDIEKIDKGKLISKALYIWFLERLYVTLKSAIDDLE